MKKDTAKFINDVMLEFSKDLARTCAEVKNECPAEETKAYLMPAAHISALVFDILDMVYAQHPDLKPPEYD